MTLCFAPDGATLAQRWARRFQLQSCSGSAEEVVAGFYLWAGQDHLELRRQGERGGAWVRDAELSRRITQGGELGRACGAGSGLEVLDVFGGWGVDGLVLAARGCRVTMVERHPAISALQEDLVRRSRLPSVRCVFGDGFTAISAGPAVDVVYLDPMFPQRGKGALPGKRMQYLAELCAPDPRPLADWLDAARRQARRRVVLKRRRHDPLIAAPDWQIVGRTVRYDVYRGFQTS